MRTSRVIHVVSCHAEGEVGDVIVGGVAPPPGDTIWEQRCFIAKDDRLRRFVLNEPRGGPTAQLLTDAGYVDAAVATGQADRPTSLGGGRGDGDDLRRGRGDLQLARPQKLRVPRIRRPEPPLVRTVRPTARGRRRSPVHRRADPTTSDTVSQ